MLHSVFILKCNFLDPRKKLEAIVITLTFVFLFPKTQYILETVGRIS